MKGRKIDIKKLLAALVPAFFLSFGGVANAQGITGSAHDLTSMSLGTDELCIFCHTPHTSSNLSPEAPLWNRQNSLESFTMYDSGVSPTIDMTVAATPQGVSMGCLSCHDGATAFDVLIKGPGGSTTVMTGDAVVGSDLTNDHPISVTYDPTQDPNFVALATVQSSTIVRLFGSANDRVECASCHDPHDNSNSPFLRATNMGSQICLACHDM